MGEKRILIVDDDPRNIFALSAVLKSRRFECCSCTSAKETLELLQTDTRFDVILMDMMMPDMDGYEAIPLIKKMPTRATIPVIAVTAQAMLGDREKCLQAGADGYISKPIDVDKLLKLLNSI